MIRAHIRFALAAAVATTLAPAALAGNMSLTIQGIPGSIEVLSFSIGATNPGSFASGGGGGAGKVKFNEFTFTATESAASPSQLDHVTRGKHIPTARLAILHPESGNPHSEWVLTDVLVTSFGVDNGAPDPKGKSPNTYLAPVTRFGLGFVKVCYRLFAANGSVAKETCFDLASNT